MAAVTGISAIPSLTSEGASSFQYRSTGSVASGGLTIPARNGHRRTLLDVFFEPATAGVFLLIQVGDKTYIRLPSQLGDYTAFSLTNKGVLGVCPENVHSFGKGLLWTLQQYVPFDFPTAAQDESIIITPQVSVLSYGALPGAYVVTAYYLDQDTGDVVSKTVPGGTAAARRLYLNDMTNALAQPASGRSNLDTVITPAGLNGIADNQKQIAGLKLTGYIFLYDASALGTTTGGNANGKPSRLHILDVDTELFTVETQEGVLVDRDLGNELAFDPILEIAYIPQMPYIFHQNRNYRFQLDTTQKAGTGTNYAASSQYFGILGIREPEVAGP